MTQAQPAGELRLVDLVDEKAIDLAFEAPTKDAAITSVVALLDAAGVLNDPAGYEAAVRKREAEFTTGLGDGIAIPHGKSEAVDRPAVAFARSHTGVDWQSPDGSPVSLIFLIAVPAAQAGDAHLKILAMLARKLVHAEFREALLAAPDVASVREVLAAVSIPLG